MSAIVKESGRLVHLAEQAGSYGEAAATAVAGLTRTILDFGLVTAEYADRAVVAERLLGLLAYHIHQQMLALASVSGSEAERMIGILQSVLDLSGAHEMREVTEAESAATGMAPGTIASVAIPLVDGLMRDIIAEKEAAASAAAAQQALAERDALGLKGREH